MIHLQRFLQGSGRSLASRIESRIGAQAGSLSSSASSIQDLEVYLPISAQRAAWHGDSRIVVAGFTESEDELRARGSVIAYDLGGQPVTLSYTAKPSMPVIAVTNAETQFGPDGISAASRPSLLIDPGGGGEAKRTRARIPLRPAPTSGCVKSRSQMLAASKACCGVLRRSWFGSTR